MKNSLKTRARRAIPALAFLGLGAAFATQAVANNEPEPVHSDSYSCASDLRWWSSTATCETTGGKAKASTLVANNNGNKYLIVSFLKQASTFTRARGLGWNSDAVYSCASYGVVDKYADGKTASASCPGTVLHQIIIEGDIG